MSQSFVFSPEWNGYRPSATRLVQKLPFFVFTSVEGREPHFRLGSPHQSFGFIFSFPFRCPATQGHLGANICVTLFSPNGHFWLLDNVSSTGGVSFPPPRLREPSRDTMDSIKWIYLEWWLIGTSEKRETEESMLLGQLDDDDDDMYK